MSKATGQLLGHADEADGIEEYDNALPDWWLGLFWFTIVWAVLYGGWYHFVGKVSQEKKLAAEIALAEQKWPRKELNAAALDLGPDAVAAGQQVFAQNCVGCHGPELKGGIGPSLVDSVWIHGATREAILTTISQGVVEKGMPPWEPAIGADKVAQVAAYVIATNGQITQ